MSRNIFINNKDIIMTDNNNNKNNKTPTKNISSDHDADVGPLDDNETTTIADHVQEKPECSGGCVVYKFKSRPPYEGFILILIIILITALLLWWLSYKFL